MSKTLSQLHVLVRDRLDEPTVRQWSDEQIKRWIMEGARDIARRCECLQATATVAAVAGTQDYSLSAVTPNIVRLHRVEYVMTGNTLIYNLEYRDLHAMDQHWGTWQAVHQGIPSLFTLWGYPPSLTLKLYPTPSTAGTLRLWYYRFPTDLATSGAGDSTAVDLPDGWEDLCLDYAEYHALRMDRDPRWQEVLQAYESRMGDIVATTGRWADQSGWITHDSGPLPNWLVTG